MKPERGTYARIATPGRGGPHALAAQALSQCLQYNLLSEVALGKICIEHY